MITTKARRHEEIQSAERFHLCLVSFVSSCLRSSIFLIAGAGCSRLTPGRIGEIDSKPQVCLIRGFQDWYSAGMDQVNGELQAEGIPSHVYREEQWKDVAEALMVNRPSSIVLIGFSYGADDVISIARQLDEGHLQVTVLITIDPVTPDAIPGNVVRCVNFYQSNGFWDLFPWLRGVPVSGKAENIDIRGRPDLFEADTSHATIAANAKIHRQIIEIVGSTWHLKR
jgi:pimeloyl-ACP methyl ester carboxylesterase